MSYHVWSDNEIQMLIAGLKRYNFDWDEVRRKILPNLTVAQIKNKFYSNRYYKTLSMQPITLQEKILLKSQTHIGQQKTNQEIQLEMSELLNKLSESLTK
ncbi:Myb-like_DNA-binding domain-containing protein [Hexamita inflata]|uniref:Myb-like DNA-binding domain-containing protein n=1 Tax=Hexamita inflata TaxID=28002 RepID=A0AA86RBH4_9EUKA|nr:Myb-like DNA-binding domain-containing protein [Hexamita inflata]